MPAVLGKSTILEEIRRTATENGGRPLGAARFETETGIGRSDWLGKFWARWGDALVEAGFAANEFNTPTDKIELAKQYAGFAKHLGHLPVEAELQLRRSTDRDFPHRDTFRNRFGGKLALIQAVAEYCGVTKGFEDVAGWCQHYLARRADRPAAIPSTEQCCQASIGYVYLAKSGRYHKIGRTNSTGRREYEIGLQLPEKLRLVHVIETDDPAGIEAYWHNRFATQRKNGEWFELTKEDVAAFKRRRKFM
jgi:hypothetical protein